MPLLSEIHPSHIMTIAGYSYKPVHPSLLNESEKMYARASASRWFWYGSREPARKVLFYLREIGTDIDLCAEYWQAEENGKKTQALEKGTQEADTAKVRNVEKE